jgi:hypothetical protein
LSASSGRSGWRHRISSIAPIALNSVAPCRRAASRKPLAENRGSSTSPAPAASDPRHEYAGALMWNSGSDVIIRSWSVSSIQYGKPTPAHAYARWVCMTSLDRPVVPEVGMNTARSSSETSDDRASSSGARQSSTRDSMDRNPPVGATSESLIRAFGWTWPIRPSRSCSVADGSVGTVTAPMDANASQHNRYGGVVRAVTMTRSPFPMPCSRNRPASRAT